MNQLDKIKNQNFMFYVYLTPQGFDHKPSESEAGYIQNSLFPVIISVSEFCQRIKQGYAYRAGASQKKTFSDFQIISLDIDGCPLTMTEYISKLKNKPTIAYTSPRNGLLEAKKENEAGIYRFRLVYVSTTVLNGFDRYASIRDFLIQDDNMLFTDSQSYPACHYFNGNGTPTAEVYATGELYDFSYIKVQTQEISPQASVVNNSNSAKIPRNEHFSMSLCEELISLGLHESFANDCEKMDFTSFLEKWQLLTVFTKETFKTASDYIEGSHPYALLAPTDYTASLHCIPWDHAQHRHVGRKWRDRENRHGKIYYSAMAIKELNPWLDLSLFIYYIVKEYVDWYENINEDGSYKYTLRSFIQSIVLPAWKDDVPFEYSPYHSKFKVMTSACIETGKTKKQLVPTIASDLRRKEIMKDYDYSLSVRENVKRYKEKGISVSRCTLLRYRQKEKNEGNIKQEEMINPSAVLDSSSLL